MRMTLSTRNASGVIANLFAKDAKAQQAVRTVVKASGFRVQARAKQLAPVRTGFLKKNIRLRFTEDRLVYQVGWDEAAYTGAGFAFYPLYTEFGTRFMSPRPCLFPAKAEEVPVFRRELNRAVRDAMRRAA